MTEPAAALGAAGIPSVQVLLLAQPLMHQGLSRLLKEMSPPCRVAGEPSELEGAPQLVIWSLEAPIHPSNLLLELERLEQRWLPAPLLLLIPAQPGCSSAWLLQLPAAGLLQEPEPEALLEAVATLLQGGRVVALDGGTRSSVNPQASGVWGTGTMGLGQWLLISGLQQIDQELELCSRLLDPPPANLLLQLILEGRLRELRSARTLLIWLWGPVSMAWSATGLPPEPKSPADEPRPPSGGSTAITLRQRTAVAVWETIHQRLSQASQGPLLRQGSAELFALEGLSPERRRDLFVALLTQLDQLLRQLRQERLRGDDLQGRWQSLQPELRRQALRQMAGPYVQLPQQGALLPVADTLTSQGSFELDDPELPPSQPMLAALLSAQPLLVDGRLLAPDEPQALLYLESLVSNWVIRSAERISADVLASCGDWPELRRYLLVKELIATRSLERLRNQLNAQQRWSEWFEKPIQLYESQRRLYRLEQGGTICPLLLTEPRDEELRQLGWLQQSVTLALEARDALAPQLRALLQRVGDLIVVVLTQVIGRAIGLVGRGILQGLGRGISRP
ncbi:DUF3685 domain-containing protein [Synechococcus sp. Cruz-9H2]|uniref:DUF3685 domain-containing protein n=1 Tax=unclassified Synechococcus TaxID=2626047 RepID=UPI0020CF6731|nr:MULTISPECIES: DUF3685 domain-containing protein [unclassified Synechococcus]MCP9818421.1 DUF3685 domain-containing protein [Synechococcus sp. Cruz-9H2]MCP9842650.1 DUF3685 domain-containing protein [Synechococcus sp. Edmonson 11F2]MCP9855314.1 DUF3685 domain-containing protein [Synechococcus sp. Cruz-9C9]MCP9862438.1 DUF3685 domain-containing protein [Synechococcus sp. Cruz-7E5]MCP9869710.1 DUF3685 domain-containing protein [Synechococcus sp. Cruz-7B9]